MRRIGSSNGLFVDGNASNGTPGTIVTAAWLNAVQEEIISVLTAAGVTIDPAKTDQLSTAMATLLRGRATVSVAGGAGVTLTAAQHSLPILILTGALTANINVIFPASTGTWVVRNQTTGAFTVTCKTAAGSGVVVSQGTSNALWGDGTNIYAEQSDWANLALTGTPTAPTAADGTNTGQLASTAFVQSAVGGYLAKAVTGGTVTLTDAEASNPVIAFTGVLTANLVVVVPATTKRLWAIYNATTGAFTLEVKTAAGTGVTVAQGKRNLCYTDGTNVYDGFNDFESIALTGVPTAPTASPGTNTTQLATMAALQQAVNGKLTKSVAGGATVTLTAAEAGYAMLELTGALTASIAVVVPAAAGQWLVKNATTGAFTLTVKTPAGAGVVVRQGMTQIVWSDGINVLEADSIKADKATTLAGYGIAVATTAEAAAGTDTSKPVTSKGIRDALNAIGAAPTYAARAWLNFNGTGTVAIRASGNVSSITDNGTGDYTVNFITAMPDANFAVALGGNGGADPITGVNCFSSGARTTTSVRISTTTSTAGRTDFPNVELAVFS